MKISEIRTKEKGEENPKIRTMKRIVNEGKLGKINCKQEQQEFIMSEIVQVCMRVQIWSE